MVQEKFGDFLIYNKIEDKFCIEKNSKFKKKYKTWRQFSDRKKFGDIFCIENILETFYQVGKKFETFLNTKKFADVFGSLPIFGNFLVYKTLETFFA